MSAAFNKAAFEAAFATSILALAASEKVSKDELRGLSRTVLEAVHITGDIAYVNRLSVILSPMNKKTARLFFEHFTGFSFDDVRGEFTTKSKKRYDAALKLANEFLEDPMNNIWSWAERHVEVAKKDFDLAQVTAALDTFTKKAKKVGLTQRDVVKAFLAGGVTLDVIMDILVDSYDVDAEESKIVVAAE